MEKQTPCPASNPYPVLPTGPPDASAHAKQLPATAPPAPPAPPAPVNYIRSTMFGANPTTAHCPVCKETTQTKVVKQTTGKTHLIALGLCVCCCWLCVPCVYCCNGLKVTNHHCSICNTYVGSYSSI